MLLPGYHIIQREIILQSDDKIYKVRLHQGDWLVTNGIVLGRFDQAKNLDWLPLEWTRGHIIVLNERLSTQIEVWSKQVAFKTIEGKFDRLVYMPDAPLPEMPRPPIRDGLGTYLRSRRTMLTANARSEYDYRNASDKGRWIEVKRGTQWLAAWLYKERADGAVEAKLIGGEHVMKFKEWREKT